MTYRIEGNRITSNQLRAARALLGWGQEDAALASGVGIATVRRLEGLSEPNGSRALNDIVGAMEDHGIQFLHDEDALGVVLRRKA